MRVGTVLVQNVIAGPVDIGTSLAYAVETEADFGELDGSLGVLYLSYDFSVVLGLRLMKGYSFGDTRPAHIQAIGTALRFTAIDVFNGGSFAMHLPVAGDATVRQMPFGASDMCALYSHGGGYSVLFLNLESGPGLGVFESDGDYIAAAGVYVTTPSDLGLAHPAPFYDGSYVFAGFGKSPATHGIMRIAAGDPFNAEAVTITAAGTIEFQSMIVLGGNTTRVVYLYQRTGNSPVFFAANTDLSVAWAKSTKKQQSTVTITANDIATTYRITISGQFEQVAGNAGGAAATATALRNQCAASAQTQFVKRTFTVATDTVTIQANDAGILYTFSASVTGGAGTISTTNDQFLLPVVPLPQYAQTADAEGRLAIPCENFGVLIIDVDDGSVLAAAEAEDAPSGVEPVGAAILNGVAYITSYSEYPDAFGPASDIDFQVLRFDSPPTNRTVLLGDVTLTLTSISINAEEDTFPYDITVDTQSITPHLDTFGTAETEYTY